MPVEILKVLFAKP